MTEETRVGVDVGGTFTDVVTVRDGRLGVRKVPSTPDAPERGVSNGLDAARDEEGVDASDIGFFGHGTTVATNAVLEGEWADTALVTTAGFRDALEIGRQNRPDIYDFQVEKPDPVVERDGRYEVRGRVDERGEELEPLNEDDARAVAAELRESGVESVAVSLLFPFENDAHERRVREILREEGVDASVSLSSSVLPEIREYERTLTTALNAALKPVMDRYIGNLSADIREAGVSAPLKIMQSNGGIITAEAARERPVNTLLSGPAAGVQGATHVATECGFEDVVTMDMGGTSCDVSLVTGGDPLVTTETDVGDYPVSVPTVDVHTVGAGGGSIAWVDAGGALRVGPRSAGADPGPICYGRGGTDPTITDAHLLLGRIDPEAFLADDLSGARSAVESAFESLAEETGTTPEAAAQGVLDVANANMERALRVVSVERGYDPREFAIVAFGGAGPLHATELADALDVPRVVVPRTAGVLSALGLLISDVLYDYSTSRVRPFSDVDPRDVRDAFAEFVEDGRERLESEGFAGETARFEASVDLRYAGQSFELSVPVDPEFDADSLADARERFHEAHERRYGHAYPEEPVELVTLRLRARGLVSPPDLDPEAREGSVADAVSETRRVVLDGEAFDARVYDRTRLPTDAAFEGPAVVEGEESTTVVHPDQTVRVDEAANLVVEVGE
ncbi:hydantoinase/oxoprolinase family protein [Halopelagius longus]|uniref:Hydantoinase/oxoprolinase family protein n=1 Tax=Halopelagius longus TaxID=1236180 RepID=A0A1H0Y2G8_9EURY|nr:hydantoinase/oxoprolinase family protein [Halopelagius longus]RDI72231.1 hydantoinase/oxoprolinase family protein [Halopelagius longus]SDQ09126.1 N-methylhydantoinase A [Halopelagius longus]